MVVFYRSQGNLHSDRSGRLSGEDTLTQSWPQTQYHNTCLAWDLQTKQIRSATLCAWSLWADKVYLYQYFDVYSIQILLSYYYLYTRTEEAHSIFCKDAFPSVGIWDQVNMLNILQINKILQKWVSKSRTGEGSQHPISIEVLHN
jgi:hypothetical protein